jgi:hypothetical protein
VIIHDAAAAFVTLIDAALLWARVIAVAGAFVALVAAWSVMLVAPGIRRRAQAARGASRRAPRDSRAAMTPERPADGRTRPRVPSWAHTEPYDYDEAA